MNGWRRRQFGNNLRSLFGWRDAGADVRDEMSLHIDLRAQELEGRGLPAAEARRRAECEVGMPVDVGRQVDRLASQTDRSSSIAQKLEEAPGQRVLGFNYDTGERYLSVPDFLPE